MASAETSKGDIQRGNTLPNGDIYVGNFAGLVPHGFGKYMWTDGTLYYGEWDTSKMTGRGVIQWPSSASYDGDLRGGFIDGTGTFKGVDGSVYKGSWRMNKKHGMGTMVYAKSDVYEGFWNEGLPDGFGKYTWAGGNIYIGSWKSGKMNGRGVMQWTNGDTLDCNWLNGLAHGKGFCKYASGACYIGTWDRGLKDGHGVFYEPGSKMPCNFEVSECATDHDVTSASSSSNENIYSGLLFLLQKLCNMWRLHSRFHWPRRISNGTTPVFDGNPGNQLSQGSSTEPLSTDECIQDSGGDKVLVYEREYVQGVLISEKPKCHDSGMLDSGKTQEHTWQKQAGGPMEIIYKGHRSYYLMLNLQLGIRYTVGKITPVPLREVRSNDFGPRARIRMFFPCEGSQYTPPHCSVNFFWKDYCPMVFRNLREMFHIDAADYMMSICGDDSLKELSSPGKSGSIFYHSQDERFVIKTLRKSELKILLKMLPKYYNHVRAYDNTLITKFFGVHRITLKAGRKVRFVVMGNMFCTELRIHRKYDLKGSTQGRSTKKQNINENTTLKDLDLSYVFHVDKPWREALFRAPYNLKTASSHENSLERCGIPDSDLLHYEEKSSWKGFLLVAHEPGTTVGGSHIRGSMVRASGAGYEEVDLVLPGNGRFRVQLGVNMPARAQKVREDMNTELENTDTIEEYDVVLYLGIIDILQEYNMSKRVEHAVKSLKFDPLSISAVDPHSYSKRFVHSLETVFAEQD
ncbi:phosphatidylinositol 4-phosphate 5-kinase 1-like isoform X2 [Phragmites australis]|uniref:phosphatidylinositol 4-phosphate 5-kinase 1-like isoform X2 n=1 Tax=Phragmites australis TaxID=29695 RepID=UPI002D76D524|nr:phosphatidylinositol 4-phosphate 5-kinase 1-like isoform X2 [Phragmites australis]